MCGITGFLTTKKLSTESFFSTATKMNNCLTHRGPDSDGIWSDSNSGIVLAHRRLSILDLSSQGNQPMLSASNRYVLSYNGEIYNHLKLRHELESKLGLIKWNGHSDTETLLAGINAWGIEETLKRSIGMFAMAFWDKLK